MFWPQVTRYRLITGHHRFGIVAYSACSVSSGVRVRTQPRRLAMRCTWMSTQMLRLLRNARISTRFAVLRPTPGSVINSSSVDGTRPPNFSTSALLVSFTNTALLR